MKPPINILITSDNNEIQFVKTIPKNKNNAIELFVYKFIKSETKLNVEVNFSEDELRRNLGNFFKII